MKRYRDWSPTKFDTRGLGLTYQSDWFVAPVIHTRDSDALEESNFSVALQLLGDESENVEVFRFNHWACGWFEIILIRPETEAASVGEDVEARLQDYPVLDEMDWSMREHENEEE
jgi:hypothetical protein